MRAVRIPIFESHHAKARMKASERGERGTAHRHIAAREVPHCNLVPRSSPIRVPEHPPELVRKPSGLGFDPFRHDLTADAQDIWIVKAHGLRSKPVWICACVVVEKYDDIVGSEVCTAVPRTRNALLAVVSYDDDRRKRIPEASEEHIVVIHHDDDLPCGK